MAERAAPHGLLRIEEYLELERDSPVRHEYVGGRTYAMTGASRSHNRISLNIASRLLAASRGGSCRVYQSDMKVLTPDELAYYPDVMVACGEEPEDEYTETAPCLIVEVLSPTTAAIDQREKLLAYRNIRSLGAYLVVSQERRHVECHFRGDDGVWRQTDLLEEGKLPVPCPDGASLTLDDIYEGL
jgi:Uma2 family endonuclease